MKNLLPPLLAACGLFLLAAQPLPAADPTSIIVWHTSIGTERTGDGEPISPLHAAGLGGEAVSFALVPGDGDNDNASFQITNSELQTAGQLPEGRYSIRLQAAVTGGLSIEEAFTIDVVPGVVAPRAAIGFFHTVLLRSDGAVYTFGRGSRGQLGHGDDRSLSYPVAVESEALAGHTIIGVAAQGEHTVLLSLDGTVFTFGRGAEGRLGHGDVANRPEPKPIEHSNLSGHTITRVAAGWAHTALLSADGTVFTFGSGQQGRLGHGNTFNLNIPTPIEHPDVDGHTITGIAAGDAHTVLHSHDGAVFTFGRGQAGALGHGDEADRPTPTRLEHAALTGQEIVEVAAGGRYSMLRSSAGAVFTFGQGSSGRLGHGDTDNRLVPTPLQHPELDGHLIAGISAGAAHSILRTEAGEIFTFGAGDSGRLGHGDSEERLTPARVTHENLDGKNVIEIAAGGSHTVAVSADGTVFTFGWGVMGKLGHFDEEDRLAPTQLDFFRLPGHRLLRLDVSGGGAGTVLVNGETVEDLPRLLQFETGSNLALEAVPATGSLLDRWLGVSSESGVNLTLNADQDRSVAAAFIRQRLVLWNDTIGANRTGAGARVGLLHAAGMGDTAIFTLAAGEGDDNNASFAVSADELQTAASLAEGEYRVRLRASTENGAMVEDTFSILVVPHKVAPKSAVGSNHTVLLSTEGVVYTFGRGDDGRLGHGNTAGRLQPTPIDHENLDGHAIIDVAAGSSHTVLLSADGTVFTFGSGSWGRLGHGDSDVRLVPTAIESLLLDGYRIVRIAAGGTHTLLLASDGTVFSFGRGTSGPLGHGDTTSHNTPMPIQSDPLAGHSITDLAASGHSVLRSAEGAVFTFGPGGSGQLGHGDTEDRLVPRQIEQEVLDDHKVTKVAAGGSFTLLLSEGGSVFTFGRGREGQLGHGDQADRTTPKRIDHPPLAEHNIVGVAAGGWHSLLNTAEGAVFSFGGGGSGKLGHGDFADRTIPARIEHPNLAGQSFLDLAAGQEHSVLVTLDGFVFTFGNGGFGRLGHGDDHLRTVPTRIVPFNLRESFTLELKIAGTGGGTVLIDGEPVSTFPHHLAREEGTEVLLEAVAGGDSFFKEWTGDLAGANESATITLDGHKSVTAVFAWETVVVWTPSISMNRAQPGEQVSLLYAAGRAGDPWAFALVEGEGDTHNASFSVDGNGLLLSESLDIGEYSIRLRATSATGLVLERVIQIAVIVPDARVALGGRHSAVIDADGGFFTFGSGTFGQTGHGDTRDQLFPKGLESELHSQEQLSQVATGHDHTVTLSSGGAVFTFGSGANGRLGHGDTEDRREPQPLVHENLDGHTIVRVAAGAAHTLLLSSDGTVFSFGLGAQGQLGHGDLDDRHVPMPIASETLEGHTIIAIAAGLSHSVLLSANGDVFTFGRGGLGELGRSPTPQRVEHQNLSGRTIVAIAAGGIRPSCSLSHTGHTVLLDADGTVLTMGFNAFGQLGHGDTNNRTAPTPIEAEVLSGHHITAVAAGDTHTLLLAKDGTVFAFGAGESGQLGHGDTDDRLAPVPLQGAALSEHKITGIAAGSRHSALTAADTTILTFGSGENGRLGHGDNAQRLVPTPIQFYNLPGHRVLHLKRQGDGTGAISVDGDVVSDFPYTTQFPAGSEVELEVIPDAGSSFAQWVGDANGTETIASVILDDDRTAAAAFDFLAVTVWHPRIGTERTGPNALVSKLHAPIASAAFELVSGEGDNDNALFLVSGDELRTGDTLSPGEYSIRLRAAGPGAETQAETALTLSVIPGKVEPKVAMGGFHTLFLARDGTVYGFGAGGLGQLGIGASQAIVPTPIENEALTGHTIIDIAAGSAHSILLSADGTVFTFGNNSFGQLGHPDAPNPLLEPTPIEAENLQGQLITGVAAGFQHTVLRTSTGIILTLGSGGAGALGQGNTQNRDVPTPIPADHLAGYTITGLSAGNGGSIGRTPGGRHTALLSLNGTVLTFGSGGSGQLGHGDRENKLIPTPIVPRLLGNRSIAGIAAGGLHTVLLTADGEALVTGGPGTTAPLSPAPVAGDSSFDAPIRRIAAGGTHTLLLAEDGSVYSFGQGANGRLGLGDTENRDAATPIQHENLAGETFVSISAGTAHSTALTTDDRLFTFGSGRNFQLGHGDQVDRLVPTPIEFFREPRHLMFVIHRSGQGTGTVVVNDVSVAEFPHFGQAQPDTLIRVEAVADPDSVFARWTTPGSDPQGIAGTDNPAEFNLERDIEFTAVFDLNARTLFNLATTEAGLSGARAEPKATPFGDGVYNLLKFAFNMDLTDTDHRRLTRGGNETGGLPSVALIDDQERFLVIEYVRRRNSDLVYTPLITTDLETWSPGTGSQSVTNINVNWERVRIEIPLEEPATRAFGSVRVRMPQE